MDKNDAIKALSDFKNKISGRLLYENEYSSELKHLIKEIFGEDSDFYTYLNRRRYADGDYSGLTGTDNRASFVKLNCNHIDSCISSLNSIGLPKKHSTETKGNILNNPPTQFSTNRNIFSHYSNAQVLISIATVFILGMTATKLIYERIDSYNSRRTPAIVYPHKIPDSSANAEKQNHDTTDLIKAH